MSKLSPKKRGRPKKVNEAKARLNLPNHGSIQRHPADFIYRSLGIMSRRIGRSRGDESIQKELDSY